MWLNIKMDYMRALQPWCKYSKPLAMPIAISRNISHPMALLLSSEYIYLSNEPLAMYS